MRKKVLFITSRLLWPVDGGRKMSLNYYCRGLYEKFGYDIYLYSFPEKGQRFEGGCPEYIKEVTLAKDISLWERIKNLIFYSFGKKKYPFQCSLFYSRKNAQAISEYCTEIKPDVIITEMIRTATYVDVFGTGQAIKIANLDDLLSKRYVRQQNSNMSKANVAGAYSGNLPIFINRIIQNQKFKKLVLKLEAERCERWEKEFYRKYDYVMFTSPIETAEINGVMAGNKAITLSVGIDYELFARHIEGLVKEKNSLSYVGNFKVASNCDTLKMICEEILPKLQHDYKFYVIGLCPQEIMDHYADMPNIVFCGRVEDLAAAVRRTEIFLAPVAYGTGIKTKIIEAMAMGMPVITNDVGAEGIAAENNRHFIVENQPEKLAERLKELMGNDSAKSEIGRNAQAFAYKFYRWDVVYKAFELAGLKI